MSMLIEILISLALLGSAIMGGVFFAFSNFVLQALTRIPVENGVQSMQSVNVTVLNPLFLGIFAGTAALSVVLILIFLLTNTIYQHGFATLGAALYITGTFGVTAAANVPLNNALEQTKADTSPSTIKLWDVYTKRWQSWNHIRTASALVATLFFSVA